MTESLAEATRAAVREHPFLLAALRAGVCNYAAAARFVDVEGDPESVATALRRFAEDLPARETGERSVTVRMESGLERAEADPLLAVAGAGFAPGSGGYTGVVATGAVDADALGASLSRLAVEGVAVEAAGVAGDALVVVVERRAGPAALRAVEAALSAVPTRLDGVSTP